MPPFLDPLRAGSKAERKKRQQRAELVDTAATERALAIITRSANKQAKKASVQDRLMTKAINDTMPEFIAALDEEALAPFFFALERLASAANRKRIAMHPLRPEIVEVMHDEADDAEALAAEAAEQDDEQARKSESLAAQSNAQKAMPQFGAQEGASAG